jgi:hypothetical protein
VVKAITRAREREARDEYILAAFIGWQMGAGDKKSFGAYLNSLGLPGESPETTEAVVDKVALDARLKSLGIVPAKGDSQ